jgi:hypothetical protein
VIILVTGSDGHHRKASTTATTSSAPRQEGRFTLKAPDPTSASTGLVEILSRGEARTLYVQAEHVPATRGFFYAIWLYNSHSSAMAISRSPEVGKTHSFAGITPLPANASEFKEILITKETNVHPTRPGHVVLRGPFKAP